MQTANGKSGVNGMLAVPPVEARSSSGGGLLTGVDVWLLLSWCKAKIFQVQDSIEVMELALISSPRP